MKLMISPQKSSPPAYRANRSIFPDCSNTSQTQATCSWVNPNEAIPPGGVTVIAPEATELTGKPEATEVATTSESPVELAEQAAAAAAPYIEAAVGWSWGNWVNCPATEPYWQTWASDENPDKSWLICEAEWIKEAAAAAEADTAETAESAEAVFGVTALKSVLLILISHYKHYIAGLISNNLFWLW